MNKINEHPSIMEVLFSYLSPEEVVKARVVEKRWRKHIDNSQLIQDRLYAHYAERLPVRVDSLAEACNQFVPPDWRIPQNPGFIVIEIDDLDIPALEEREAELGIELRARVEGDHRNRMITIAVSIVLIVGFAGIFLSLRS